MLNCFSRIFVFTAGLLVCGVSVTASAETISRSVSKNKASGVLALGAYGFVDCGVYLPRSIKITTPPQHGSASIVKHEVTFGEEMGVCKGTKANLPWVVYQPAKNYVGPDQVSVSYTIYKFTNDVRTEIVDKDVIITVK